MGAALQQKSHCRDVVLQKDTMYFCKLLLLKVMLWNMCKLIADIVIVK